jgi:transposase
MEKLDPKVHALLKQEQRKTRDKKIYVKVTIILMLDKGFTPQQVAEVLGIDDATVYRHKERYETEGLQEYLKDRHFNYKGTITDEEKEIIKKEVATKFYRTATEVRDYISKALGKKLSVSAVTKLLLRLGFVYKKTRHEATGDPVAQQAFADKIKQLAEDEDSETYFTDGTHPQHNTRSENGWIPKGGNFEIPPNSGRGRLNINGAINAGYVTLTVSR